MLYSKIVVGYDGSELADRALQMSIELAKSQPATEIVVLHAIESVASLSEYSGFAILSRIEDAKKQGEYIKVKAEKILASIPNRWTLYIVEERPDKAILQQGEKLNADLIVMGSRGLSGVKEFFLGSVSHYVTQHSKIPVLIVK
ncbi:hypothetical protein SD71_08955 [Cohnella kolymensis]|uniref:UspA domain-containing protein n=1 Tax=Cohnella kolymensis TaxID=1590652 RepID=A0ABR5A518_9BACL|nr:universal stress protein [Cohnella kolymensis]KIL36109.1 hypothetical protein SD71_08955 [Cohnella kolymensis]